MKYKDIKTVRLELLKQQNNLCALCQTECINPCLDHDHTTGFCRAVICRTCNSYLGKIENSRVRYKLTDKTKFENVINNVLEYISKQTDLIHPTFGKIKRRKKNGRLDNKTRKRN